MAKKHILSLGVAALIFSAEAQAQGYHLGIGARLGFYSGGSVKYFIQPEHALEGLVTTRWKGYQLSLLYEFHRPVSKVRSSALGWYWGFGAHAATYSGGHYPGPDGTRYSSTVTALGADLLIGLEYVFTDAPINVSVDVRPFYEFVNPSPENVDVALSLRFYFD